MTSWLLGPARVEVGRPRARAGRWHPDTSPPARREQPRAVERIELERLSDAELTAQIEAILGRVPRSVSGGYGPQLGADEVAGPRACESADVRV
jgi:hypothetical protein